MHWLLDLLWNIKSGGKYMLNNLLKIIETELGRFFLIMRTVEHAVTSTIKFSCRNLRKEPLDSSY